MVQVQQRILKRGALLLAAALLFVSGEGHARKFYADDPLPKEPQPLPVKDAAVRDLNEVFDFAYHNFAKRPEEKVPKGKRRPSGAVNTLGEAPDNGFYQNRHGMHPMSIEELVRGPGDRRPPSPSGPWRIVSAKISGVTPGFTIEDPAGTRYLLKFDSPRYQEMASAADVIGSKFFYAFGYNVPENYIVRFKREQLVLSAPANLRVSGKSRLLKLADVDDMLASQPVDAQGRYRAMASRYIEGKLLGQFRYYGTRSDDPNDLVPHEHRRDLRGLSVFCAWLNHDDSRDVNTKDSLVEEDGSRYIKHYLIDFGAVLGSNTYRPDSPRNGFEYLFDVKPAAVRFFTLGLYVPRWSRSAHYPDLPSVGRFEYELFEPDSWKPEYPNIAFHNRDPEDTFWAAKQVMAFSDEQIRALVKTGQYSDPRAEDWVTRCLMARRDKIGRAYFARLLPLDRFQVKDGRLQFADLSERYGFTKARPYRVEWSAFDNDREKHAPIPDAGGFELPKQIGQARDGEYFAATIRADEPHKTVIVYLRKTPAGMKVVGVDRTW